MNAAVLYALVVGIDLGVVLMNIPPVLDLFLNLYQASYTHISILISSIMWTHGLVQIPGGLVIDSLGVRRGLLISLGAIAAGNILSLITADYALAVSGRIICGIGTGLGFVTTMKLIALSVSQEKIGVYQAYLGGIISLGSILTFLSFPRLSLLGWEVVFAVPGLFTLVLLAFLPYLRLQAVSASVLKPAPYRTLLFSSRPWIFGFIQSLSWGPVIAFGNWGAAILAEAAGNSSVESFAWFGALVMAISGAVRMLGGPALNTFSPRGIILWSNGLLGLSFFVLVFTRDPAPLLLLISLTAAFASFNFGAIFHLVSTSAPPSSLGLMLGIVIFMANMGAFLLTFLFGWMKDLTGSFHLGFAFIAPLFFLAIELTRRVSRKKTGENS